MQSFNFLLNEESFEREMSAAEEYLSSLGGASSFKSFDGREISYESYIIDGSDSAVVILHGFTESAEKFRECAYYFLKSGMSVFALDHRGHGKSYRQKGNAQTVYLRAFSDYVNDLDEFIKQVVSKRCAGQKLFLFAHSMGGAIGVKYLQEHGSVFSKAVLSSPMICANTGMPLMLARILSSVICAVGGAGLSMPGRCVFRADEDYKDSDDTSKARFDYYMKKRVANELYRTSGPSFGWVREAVKVVSELTDDVRCGKIGAEILLLQPEFDRQVLSEDQDIFIKKVKNGRLVKLKNCKHEIYNSENSVLDEYYSLIFAFLS